MHRILLETTIPETSGTLTIEGDEAAHAVRVKRLAPGEPVELLDGHGNVARAVVADPAAGGAGPASHKHAPRSMKLLIQDRRKVARVVPELEVCAATPKGQAVDQMIDQLTQIGAASWRPLHCARSVVDPRETKLHRLERLAHEACKQSGRAWLLRIDSKLDLAAAIAPASGLTILLADASGAHYAPAASAPGRIRLLIGPEGGFTPDELAAARAAGVVVTCFGPHIMRIETAAVAAAAILLSSAKAE